MLKITKTIYFSLGTVVTNNLWNHQPVVKSFVTNLLDDLVNILGNTDIKVIVATGRDPPNFEVFKFVNQLEVLAVSDLFITHGGGNSFNEALQLKVPMIVIPFFGDQHLVAHKVQKLNLGISFPTKSGTVSTEVDSFSRPIGLSKAIWHILDNLDYYKENIIRLTRDHHTPADMFLKYYHIPIIWKNGDLLFGTNHDTTLKNALRYANIIPFRSYLQLHKI